jgi:hypothetical protein
MAILAMLEHGQDARGTASRLSTPPLRIVLLEMQSLKSKPF